MNKTGYWLLWIASVFIAGSCNPNDDYIVANPFAPMLIVSEDKDAPGPINPDIQKPMLQYTRPSKAETTGCNKSY